MTTTLVGEYRRAERKALIEQTYSRRQFLTYLLITDGVEPTMAEGMVHDISEARPGLDMEERLTWAQWLDLANVPNDIARWHMASMLDAHNDTPSPGEG